MISFIPHKHYYLCVILTTLLVFCSTLAPFRASQGITCLHELSNSGRPGFQWSTTSASWRGGMIARRSRSRSQGGRSTGTVTAWRRRRQRLRSRSWRLCCSLCVSATLTPHSTARCDIHPCRRGFKTQQSGTIGCLHSFYNDGNLACGAYMMVRYNLYLMKSQISHFKTSCPLGQITWHSYFSPRLHSSYSLRSSDFVLLAFRGLTWNGAGENWNQFQLKFWSMPPGYKYSQEMNATI